MITNDSHAGFGSGRRKIGGQPKKKKCQNTTQHSTGKWFSGAYEGRPTVRTEIEGEYYDIAEMCDLEGAGDEEEMVANARLIAAAPELLTACQEALRDLLYLGAKLKSITVLEAAIKKALGE